MLEIGKKSYRPSTNPIACPASFSMSENGIQKDCKKDFDEYQYTKKCGFLCHTAHSISPVDAIFSATFSSVQF